MELPSFPDDILENLGFVELKGLGWGVTIGWLRIGDHVLRRAFPNTQESNAGKLSIKWEGPYIITKIVGKGAYKISTIEGNEIPRSWNATHLKRYYF
ncbi:hypothetical protein OSB04_028964 [Centaurea solstitialis]|uniref:Uncharacterized protein n=1 Tax=Centaurea solstitialis TaxID=347529 RepID=A0AA38SHJ7_9ASTR|nr:hypothetical protein OSB04_028964 [Centaurea solstitialis]